MEKTTYKSLLDILESKRARVSNAQVTLLQATKELVKTVQAELDMPDKFCTLLDLEGLTVFQAKDATLPFKIEFNFPVEGDPFKIVIEGKALSKSDGIYFVFMGPPQLVEPGTGGWDYKSVAASVIALLRGEVQVFDNA